MRNTILTIENTKQPYYNSDAVSDKLGINVLKATAILVVNIYENMDDFVIKITSSGYTRENFDIHVSGKTLTIHGHQLKNSGLINNMSQSIGVNTFSKKFIIPKQGDTNRIKTNCVDGVLTIQIPKR
ncbi:MAG: Hsp20/alpha crystallin family protein [Flavobacteriaceae bacterium]|nr:Hsp20/alpha crystallin family protein [Flavobacteriaceae bacterium]